MGDRKRSRPATTLFLAFLKNGPRSSYDLKKEMSFLHQFLLVRPTQSGVPAGQPTTAGRLRRTPWRRLGAEPAVARADGQGFRRRGRLAAEPRGVVPGLRRVARQDLFLQPQRSRGHPRAAPRSAAPPCRPTRRVRTAGHRLEWGGVRPGGARTALRAAARDRGRTRVPELDRPVASPDLRERHEGLS